MKRTPRKTKAELFVTKWVTKLGLLDWFFVFKLDASPEDMEGEAFGTCQTSSTSKRAVITVLAPKYFYGPYTWENTVVHELVEVCMSDLLLLIDMDKNIAREKERVVETITRALIGGY